MVAKPPPSIGFNNFRLAVSFCFLLTNFQRVCIHFKIFKKRIHVEDVCYYPAGFVYSGSTTQCVCLGVLVVTVCACTHALVL